MDPHRPDRRPPAAARLRALLVAVLALTGVLAVPAAAHAEKYSAPLTTAIADLTGASEVRDGYDRDLFRHWVDADGDGCDTRDEVLIAESQTDVTVDGSCAIGGGRWYSYYDQLTWTDSGRVDIDHLVPMAEAWDSGARRWTDRTRERYANDLGDARSLIGVTDSVNQSKGDQDPAEWMPEHGTCRYVRQWVAVKHRWRLTADRPERQALRALASDCRNATITVTLAR